jgi:polar amino acid transport system permease protein
MDWQFLPQYLPVLITATETTISLSLLALLGGCSLGVAIALLRLLTGSAANAVASGIVDAIRTTPLLVQILIWYLGAAAVGHPMDPFAATFVALSVNSGAFISEIVRGAIIAVPRGQREAALSVGLSRAYSILTIEMPQAAPAIVPALISFFIGLIKDTSLAYIVGLLELTRTGAFISNQNGRPLETYIAIAVIYFFICFPVSRFGKYVDRRLRRTGLVQERLFV